MYEGYAEGPGTVGVQVKGAVKATLWTFRGGMLRPAGTLDGGDRWREAEAETDAAGHFIVVVEGRGPYLLRWSRSP